MTMTDDLLADPELVAFRDRYRLWLDANVPTGWRDSARAGLNRFVDVQRQWMGALDAGGWAAPKWPTAFGGLGADLARQVILDEENRRVDAPPTSAFRIGLNHTGATLIVHGTPEQQLHLPRIRSGEEIWCQGFSEPNAGSDLAALQTRATRDGDHYIVNGQKVWSSGAHYADWCLLLARTDPFAAKHHGISYFLLDLKSPGVEVRPLRQLTGDAEFCEIFLSDVSVPAKNLVGAEGRGWQIAQTTLQTERGAFLLARTRALRSLIGDVLSMATTRATRLGRVAAQDGAVRQRLAADYAEAEILIALCERVLASEMKFGHAGPQASIVKLLDADVTYRVGADAVAIAGLPAMLDPGDPLPGDDTSSPLIRHLSSLSMRIAGGTREIQRNIVGERILGLPREPRGELR